MTIALVTDSTADIPGTIAEDLAIKVIPALLHVGHKTLLDGQDITRERFYDILPSLTPYPTTAAATVGSFAEAYQHALSSAEHVVSVHLSSKLSAVIANARLAAHELDHRRIHIIDTGMLSMGVGWSVIMAARVAREGGTLEHVLESLQRTISRTRVFATFNNLNYLRRSGRLNGLHAGLGQMLDIKLILEVWAGEIKPVSRVRTWKRALNSLQSLIAELDSISHIAVIHADYETGAYAFLEQSLLSRTGIQSSLITPVTPALGVHVGPQALGVAVVTNTISRSY